MSVSVAIPWLLTLTVNLLAQVPASSPTPAPAVAKPVAEAERKPAERAPTPHEFVTFGNNILRRAHTIANVEVKSLFELGQGVAIARCTVEAMLKGDRAAKELVVLSAPGDLAVGNRYVVFVETFGEGGRFRLVNRFASSERDFDDKVKVLEQYLEILEIKDVGEQLDALRDRLLLNVSSERVFVKWNAVEELRAFAKAHAQRFAAPHRARLVAAWRAEASATFRDEVKKVLADLGVPLNEERRG